MHFGHPGHKKHLPDSWLTTDAAEVVLVICVGDKRYGSAVETCSYEYYGDVDPGPPSDQYVGPSPSDVRAACESLINP